MNKSKIINIIIICILCISLILGIYFYISIQSKKEETYKEEIYNYLNQDIPSIYGLMNYDFEEINSNISIEVLQNAYFLENSLLNEEGVNDIYKSLYNVDKSKYISASNYVSNPLQNCYYHQNTLKESGYNCDSVCSKSTSDIMNEIHNKLGWDNILPDDTKTYCIKNAVYLLEGSGYFVNLNDLKTLYKSLTNLDIEFNSTIKENKYYKYNAYLSNSISKLTKYVKSISSVDSVSKSENIYIANYTAILSDETTIEGTIKLQNIENKYYIVANSIGLGYNLN